MYTVFNVPAQTKDVALPPKSQSFLPHPDPQDRNPMVDDVVDRTGARVQYRKGSIPCYSPKKDLIIMPRMKDFISWPEAYGCLTHEIVHWTSAEERCNRLISTESKDRQYAYEELVAEIGAAFLCAWLRVPIEKVQHVEYLSHWADVLGEHPSVLWSAASKAQQAFDYLRDLTKYEVPVDEDQNEAVNE
jgi:antirestriction protein ArdC